MSRSSLYQRDDMEILSWNLSNSREYGGMSDFRKSKKSSHQLDTNKCLEMKSDYFTGPGFSKGSPSMP
jgi:hypothetical protein